MINYAENRIGQQIGNYRLTRLLGQGGFADVYLGEHLYLKTYAALKLLRNQLSDKDLEDFLKEARTIARLEHPHIVRVLECGVEANGIPFLVMNYASNGSLRQRHPRGSRLPLELVCSYVQQIASALDYAHQEKLIHRDIKPENILLGHSNEVLLSDFGLVLFTQTTSSHMAKEMAGTAAYMAPEQLQGKPRSASDQYALGIIVYEWLCGERPFQGSLVEVASQHLMVPPPSLHKRMSDISPAVESVVFTALAKDTQQRFPTVTAFATALEHASKASLSSFIMPLLTAMPSGVDTYSISNMSPLNNSSTSMSTYTPINMSTPTANGVNPTNSQQSSTALTPSWNQLSEPGPIPISSPTFTQPTASLPPSNNLPTPSLNIPLPPTTGNTPSTRAGDNSIPTPFLRRNFKFLLITLTLLVILGSSGTYWTLRNFPSTSSQNTPVVHHTATTATSTLAPCGSSSYPMYGFDLQHTHYNPNETCLSTSNVSKLTLAWKAPTEGPIWSSPVVANNMVYIGSDDEMLHAFDVTTGKPRWSYFTDGPIRSAPMIANGIAYVAPNGPTLSAINASDGTPVWKAVLSSKITFSSPLVAYGKVYVGDADGNLYVFKDSGCDHSPCPPLWAVPLHSRIDAPPSTFNRVIYLPVNDTMYAVDAFSSNVLWHNRLSYTNSWYSVSSSSPAIANSVVYVGSSAGIVGLQAFDVTTKALLWSRTLNDGVNSSAAVANGIVYIGTTAGTLYAFNASNGNPIWSFSTGNGIYSTPTIANGVLYVGSEDGRLYAFKASGCGSSTCQPLWSYATGKSIESSPIVVNGMVYVGSTDKNLYAFHLPDTKP